MYTMGEGTDSRTAMDKQASAYVVMAETDYEGSAPVRVFLSKDDAFYFREECTAYHEQRPKSPRDMGDEPAWEAYWAAEETWRAAHPAGEEWAHDYFSVREVPLSPAAREAQGTSAEEPSQTGKPE